MNQPKQEKKQKSVPVVLQEKILMVGDVPTATGRIYPRELLVSLSTQPQVKLDGFIIGCGDTPAFFAENLRMQNNSLICDITLSSTPRSSWFYTLVRSGHGLILTPIGSGDLEADGKTVKVEGYSLTGVMVSLS